MIINLTKKTYEKKINRKTVYDLIDTVVEKISEQEYTNYINSAPFMRRLGGSEYLEWTYTRAGYKVTRIISKSPDKQTKIEYKFSF